jgi:hypothetical protein
MSLNKITNDLLDKITDELNRPEIKKKITDKCIKPFLEDLNIVTQKYFITIILLYGVVILLLLLIIYIIICKNNKQ